MNRFYFLLGMGLMGATMVACSSDIIPPGASLVARFEKGSIEHTVGYDEGTDIELEGADAAREQGLPIPHVFVPTPMTVIGNSDGSAEVYR